MTTQDADERRDSFRVNMTAFVSMTKNLDQAADASDCFPELHAMSLLSQNDTIEQELNTLSDRIKDLAVRKSLVLLREKLTLIAKLIDVKTAQENELKATSIDISEGGCSLMCKDQYVVGDQIALALIFTPSYFALFVFGTLADISSVDGEQRYHITFDPLTETQRQKLLKNMFKAQTKSN